MYSFQNQFRALKDNFRKDVILSLNLNIYKNFLALKN